MIDYENVRFPVIIISTARSGSSALSQKLHEAFPDVPVFFEPDSNEESLEAFLNYAKNNTRYITKIHGFNLIKYPYWFVDTVMRSPEPYKISITRNNVIEQSTSLYIEYCRDEWVYYKSEKPFISDVLKIDNKLLVFSLIAIVIQNKVIRMLENIFDLNLQYEDLDLTNNLLSETPKPVNYDEILEAMRKTYNFYLTNR